MKGKLLFFLLLFFIGAAAQNTSRPVNNQLVEDWLVKPVSSKAEVIYNESKKEIIFSNGLFNRKFRIFPNVVCIDYKNNITGQQLLRAVSPEARITINGKEYNVGGLYGQKEKAYLLPEWADGFTKNDSNFMFEKYEVSNTQPFINWAPGKWWATNKQYPGGKKMKYQILGIAWPGHFNKPLAIAMHNNIVKVGLPVWSDDDKKLAAAVQKLVDAPKIDEEGKSVDGLSKKIDTVKGSVPFSWGGGSDDIADISWNVPTIVLWYPANIPGTKGHHWADAIAMATPIAHKGTLAGAKATALTLIDMFTTPSIIANAKDYFKNVQTKDVQYKPFITKDDPPATFLNKEIMEKYRSEMKKFYYNPAKYKTYLEQLGITYPTLEKK